MDKIKTIQNEYIDAEAYGKDFFIFNMTIPDFIEELKKAKKKIIKGEKGYYKNVFAELFPTLEVVFGHLIRKKGFIYTNNQAISIDHIQGEIEKLMEYLILSIPYSEENVKICFNEYGKSIKLINHEKKLKQKEKDIDKKIKNFFKINNKDFFMKPKELINVPGIKRYEESFCVYFLRKKGTVCYVGQTGSLDERIKSHKKNKVFDEIYFIKIPDDYVDDYIGLVSRIEEKYIRMYRPEYNIVKNRD